MGALGAVRVEGRGRHDPPHGRVQAGTGTGVGGARVAGAGPGDAGGVASNPFFSAHARAYAQSASHSRGADLAALLRALRPQAGERAADVGTGTGHTALALAERGLEVVGVDPTPAMLEEARRLAARRGLAGRIRWCTGDADHLPLGDGAVDLVTCRRAAHHFPDVGHALAEMARVLRPGGRLGVADHCPPPEAAEASNRVERLRDATHVRALTEEEWRTALRAAGFTVTAWEVLEERVSFAGWLSPVRADGPEAAAVTRALTALPEGVRRALTGGKPDGWVKRRLVLVATLG